MQKAIVSFRTSRAHLFHIRVEAGMKGNGKTGTESLTGEPSTFTLLVSGSTAVISESFDSCIGGIPRAGKPSGMNYKK